MQMIELEGVDGSITIDTPLIEYYKGLTSCNSKMNEEFPRLLAG